MSTDLAWPGLVNARDLGGTPTVDGRRIRPGALVRAESPHVLDAAGWRCVADHGVRTVVDLRSDWEVADAPYEASATAAGLAVVPVGWEDGLLDDEQFRAWAEGGRLGGAHYYADFLARWPARTAAALRAVADAAPGGVLVHCVQGRERAGLLVALLLTSVGVAPADVVADHGRSTERYEEAGRSLGLGRRATEARLWAEAGTTRAAFLEELFGGYDVGAELGPHGLTSGARTRLRERLVEPARPTEGPEGPPPTGGRA